MSKTYFGFAIADSMLPDTCQVSKRPIDPILNKSWIEEAVPCVNPSHVATLRALKERYGIEIEVPAAPPQVNLIKGDVLIVMSVRGLPRLTDRHEYTTSEIEGATFKFSWYEVEQVEQ